MTVGIHGTQIHNRPPRTWTQTAHAIVFFLVFISGCLMINAAQFVFLLPLRFLPLASARSLYYAGIRLSEGAFATLLSKCHSPFSVASIKLKVMSSSHVPVVRTFASRHQLRTRRPWRILEG